LNVQVIDIKIQADVWNQKKAVDDQFVISCSCIQISQA